jgi:UDP-N-acetylglucosamine--N-acetylmuramyl-(pentapeptide) pyrophosphoryl-undecaprenol N-acetylglucosamine transferase
LQRNFNPSGIGKNLLLPFRILKSIKMTKKVFNAFKPDVVVGTGGYASALPIREAISRDIPVLIQEQNSFPGITTRWFADKADTVCIAFEEAKNHLKKKLYLSPETQFEPELMKETA